MTGPSLPEIHTLQELEWFVTTGPGLHLRYSEGP